MTSIQIYDKVGTALNVGSVVSYTLTDPSTGAVTTLSGTVVRTYKYHGQITRVGIAPSGGGEEVSRENLEVTVTG